MKLLYTIPTLVIASLVILISIPQSEAQTTPTHLVSMKAVVVFESSNNISQVHNYYNANVKPDLVTLINQYGSNIDNFSYETRTTNDALYSVGVNQQNGKNIYELYPKTTFYGSLPDGVTNQQFKTSFNNFINDVKSEIQTELETSGADIVYWRINYDVIPIES